MTYSQKELTSEESREKHGLGGQGLNQVLTPQKKKSNRQVPRDRSLGMATVPWHIRQEDRNLGMDTVSF